MKYIRYVLMISLVFSSMMMAKEITINFQNTPIVDVIKFVASKSDKNILINEPINGRVNFISNKPVDEKELLPLLEHILMVKGYALSSGEKGYLEIVRAAKASKSVSFGKKTDVGMKIVILRPKYAKPSVIVAKIKHLASQYAVITYDDQMGLLIISDYSKNIDNMRKLLHLFDAQLKKEIKRVKLENSNVKIALPKLRKIFEVTKDDYKGKVLLTGDENQNAIWISANSDDIAKAVKFVRAFDTYSKDSSTMSTKIIFLKNANVEDIIKTAKEIAKSKDMNKPVKSVITSNKELNALVISSTVEQIKELKKIISQLDIERKQVFVQVQIYEVSQNHLKKLGIQWGAAGGTASGVAIGTANINMGGSAFVLPNILSSTLNLNKVSKGLALGATIDMLQTQGAVNVLSQPNLLSVNNIKSTIYVGKTQSILTSSSTGASSTDLTRNSYSRVDIGLTLEITPQIADGGNVILKILINVEDVDPTTAGDKPTTTKRKVDTTAIVQNEDSIIIGGLIRDTTHSTEMKVPLLGDLPFMGPLFRSENKNHDKISTIMVITPYIISNSKDLANIQTKLERVNFVKKELGNKMQQVLLNEKAKKHNRKKTFENNDNQAKF